MENKGKNKIAKTQQQLHDFNSNQCHGLNLFDYEKIENEELVTILLENDCARIERIVSEGEKSPDGFFYDQDEDEWVCILEGTAQMQVNGKSITLKKGDTLFIEKHAKHRILYTSKPCIWLCIFLK